jgi:2'-5' RNA ligase
VRLFIAVPIEERVKAAVAEILAGLEAAGADCKWAKPGNLHLTLAFLGETPESLLPAVERVLARAAAGRAAFDLELKGLGFFGPADFPRVVWLGVAEGQAALSDAARALREALAAEGLPAGDEGRGFHAHLTLGRVRSRRGLGGLQDLLSQPSPPGLRSRADRLVLFESRLGVGGPSHASLRELPLRG